MIKPEGNELLPWNQPKSRTKTTQFVWFSPSSKAVFLQIFVEVVRGMLL